MMNSDVIGKTIRQYRDHKSMSQEILSGLAGIDRSHLSKIELGLRSPTVNVLYKLAEAMDMKASEILITAEKMEQENRK